MRNEEDIYLPKGDHTWRPVNHVALSCRGSSSHLSHCGFGSHCYLIFCLLTSYLTAVFYPCVPVGTVCNEGLIHLLNTKLRHSRQKNKTACLHHAICRNIVKIGDTRLFLINLSTGLVEDLPGNTSLSWCIVSKDGITCRRKRSRGFNWLFIVGNVLSTIDYIN